MHVQSFRGGVEDPLELEVLGRVGDDVTAHLDPLPLGHPVHLDLARLAKGLVWKETSKHLRNVLIPFFRKAVLLITGATTLSIMTISITTLA